MTPHLPHEMHRDILAQIVEGSHSRVNFPRILNRELRSVIQNAPISSPRGPGSSLFISGIPYAIDTFRQFVTLVNAVFQKGDSVFTERSGTDEWLIGVILRYNPALRDYIRTSLSNQKSEAVVS
jgi:hypothetical protein